MEALLIISGAGLWSLISKKRAQKRQRKRVTTLPDEKPLLAPPTPPAESRRRAQRPYEGIVGISPSSQPISSMAPEVYLDTRGPPHLAPDQSYNTPHDPDHLPNTQSVYASVDTEPILAHPGVHEGYKVPHAQRPNATQTVLPQYHSYTPQPMVNNLRVADPYRIAPPMTSVPHRHHTTTTASKLGRPLRQMGAMNSGDTLGGTQLQGTPQTNHGNYFEQAFGDTGHVSPYQSNPLRYPDGITPSFGSNTGKVLRPEALPSHLYQPPKREQLQNIMRAPPQPQRDVFGAPQNYTEMHQRALEQRKLTSGNGALDTYTPYEGGQQEGFANGQYMTERHGGFHPRTRFYPSTEYKKGVQMYGRLGNPSDAIGRPGSTFSQGVGPLGAMRMPRNVHVSEYEREPMPTHAVGHNPVGARIGSVILKPTYRSETTRAYAGPVGQSERYQPYMRLKNRYVRPKNSISREEVGFVGRNGLDRGAYATTSVRLLGQNRDTTECVGSEHVQTPGLATNSKPGAYSTSSAHLQGQNRDTTGRMGSEHVQTPGLATNSKPGAYSTSAVRLYNTNRSINSVGSEHVQTPGLATNSKQGAYSTSAVRLYNTNRSINSVGSEHVQTPGLATNSARGAYSTSSVHLQGQNRDTTTVGSEHHTHGAFENKGTNALYGSTFLQRYTPKQERIAGRPAGPSLAHDTTSDVTLKNRINNHDDMRYTQKNDPSAILYSPLRAPNSNHTGAMQYQLDFPSNTTRRVTPTIVNRIDSSLNDAYKNNPYTQPLTAP